VPSHESSMRNLAKAREGGPPRPWCGCEESRVIRRYAFLWYTLGGKRPSGPDWAQQLGISHKWLQNLVRELTADPSKARECSQMMKEYGELLLSRLARMSKFFER
jgi:hypothetical protein